ARPREPITTMSASKDRATWRNLAGDGVVDLTRRADPGVLGVTHHAVDEFRRLVPGFELDRTGHLERHRRQRSPLPDVEHQDLRPAQALRQFIGLFSGADGRRRSVDRERILSVTFPAPSG